MNKTRLEKNGHDKAVGVRKEINSMFENGIGLFSKLEDGVSHAAGKAREDIGTWVGDGVSQLSGGIEKITDDAMETVGDAATTVKKEVGYGLRQYNHKVQDIADKAPGSLGYKAARYPWVAVSIALLVGLMLGVLLKPTRRI